MQMPYDNNGEKCSLITSAFQGAYADIPFKLKERQVDNEYNIYLQLMIFDIPVAETYCLSTENTTLHPIPCGSLFECIYECVDEMFLIDETDTILNDYKNAIKRINLKDIGLPILSFDVSNNIIDYRVRYISNIIR